MHQTQVKEPAELQVPLLEQGKPANEQVPPGTEQETPPPLQVPIGQLSGDVHEGPGAPVKMFGEHIPVTPMQVPVARQSIELVQLFPVLEQVPTLVQVEHVEGHCIPIHAPPQTARSSLSAATAEGATIDETSGNATIEASPICLMTCRRDNPSKLVSMVSEFFKRLDFFKESRASQTKS